jgi:hypothetical protein
METPILRRSYSKRDNFLSVGFNHIEQKTGGLNPNVRAVSNGSNFTTDEVLFLSKNHADNTQVNTIKDVLPMRILMSNALKRKGLPAPPNIVDLTNSFYKNVVKTCVQGKQFEHAEGNPILYKLHADSSVITATVGIIPAATGFVNFALNNNDPTMDQQLVADANDIRDYINAKTAGVPTDNVAVQQFVINPWFVAALILAIILIFRKH